MSQDQRNDIIHKCVPDLVKQLTGFDNDDSNTEQCVHFAWNIIRNHRNLSTNSHEVRRKIEGIQERFRVENCAEYAEYLGRLCDEVVKHPMCLDHYEVDVHWSLLDFLFTLAYNPTGALKKNRNSIEIKPPICEDVEVEDKEKEYWGNTLKEDFIPVRKYESSDSELSDWSDIDADYQNVSNTLATTVENITIDDDSSVKSTIEPSILGEFKPPKKSTPFCTFDTDNVEERLREKIQHSWWNTDQGEKSNAKVESDHRFANFSLDYCRYLSETSNNLIRFEEPRTIMEQHVMREILWMFQKPRSCSVFSWDKNSELKINAHVTIPSSGVNAFHCFLEEQYLPYIKMMHTLRQFHKDIYNCEDCMPPRTLECYASNLHLHLMPVWDAILEYEKRLMEPKDFEINTLITMRAYLNDSFRHLASLYELHKQVVIDWRQHPAHITSAFLLSSVMNCYLLEIDVNKANLYMSLLLASIKTFCEIIEIWWIDGRLDDWRQEYIVERAGDCDQSVCVREYRKNNNISFFVPSNVTKTIEENILFQLMKEHSLEAGRTLNLLYEIKRIGDLRKNFHAIGEKFYNVFVEDFLTQVKVLQADVKKQCTGYDVAEIVTDDSGFYNETAPHTRTNNNSQNSILNSLTTNDSYLLMAFALNTSPEDIDDHSCSADLTYKDQKSMRKNEINARYIYDILQNSKYSLPLEQLLNAVLNRLLKRRIAFADKFVLQLYRDEFKILKHLRNIRKVLLLEASDIMHQFYSNLFNQIESGEAWANPSLLTMQFDDILSSKFADLSSLFSIEINSAFRCRTTKVVEVVEEIIVNYSLNPELSHIITQEDMQSYNKVFCFLLKVKWGITTLEMLRFPRSHKRRIPYARFEMIDLIMRRLEQLRFWMMYAIQSVHFHLMTHVLQSMGEQLDVKIENCENLIEMEMVHKSYLSTVCEHCFLVDSVSTVKLGVEQLLSLVSILRGEWQSCVKYIESNNPLAISLDDSSDDDTDTNFVANSQIDAMEYTYICCHQYLANILNDQVYLRKKTFLSGLRAAFNTSLPH